MIDAVPMNALLRPRLISRTRTVRSIAYGDGPRRTLDVYAPKSAVAAPVVVFFYGGAWQGGGKAIYQFVATALAGRGYTVVVPDYRIYPQARYPDFIEDGALAVRWTIDNAGRFGGDPGKVFVMGHSAGAHIAAMLAVDSCWLQQVGLTPGRDIAGLIGVAGPYDFVPLRDEVLKIIFGGANRPETQPIFYVRAGAPPALLLTGSRDTVVDAGNTERFAARLRAAGNDVTVVSYPGAGHYVVIAAFAWPLRFLAPVLPDVDAFIDRTAARVRTWPASP